MAALNAQTHAQFQQYAAQQHPGDGAQVSKLLPYDLSMTHSFIVLSKRYQSNTYKNNTTSSTCSITSNSKRSNNRSRIQPRTLLMKGRRMKKRRRVKIMFQKVGGRPNMEPDYCYQQWFQLNRDLFVAGSQPRIVEPSMWTRPQLEEFKEQIRRDPESVITVSRGEVVTVRVPTHEEGDHKFGYILWRLSLPTTT